MSTVNREMFEYGSALKMDGQCSPKGVDSQVNYNVFMEDRYNHLVSLIDKAENPEELKELKSGFISLSGYKKSEEFLKEVENKLMGISFHDGGNLYSSTEKNKVTECSEEYENDCNESGDLTRIKQFINAEMDEELIAWKQERRKRIEKKKEKTNTQYQKHKDIIANREERIKDEIKELKKQLNIEKGDTFESKKIQNRISLLECVINGHGQIAFGRYEQGKGNEAILWRFLKTDGTKALFISEKGLDCQRYDSQKKDITWEKCSLRHWLNNEFLNSAFTLDERARIVKTRVTADKNPKFNTDSGEDTMDRVFLLSLNQEEELFDSDADCKCEPTDYVKKLGALFEYGQCWWWLRSPGCVSRYAAYVNGGGSPNYHGSYVNYTFYVVRPALWIDLNL